MQHALIQEVFDDFDEAWLFELVEGAPRVTGGVLEAPNAPGLGVRLNHAVAAAHPPAPLDFNHWQEGWERRATPFDAPQPTAGRR
jgi:galactonate dehydratase